MAAAGRVQGSDAVDSEAGIMRAGCGTGRKGVGDRADSAGGNGGAVVMHVTMRTGPPCCRQIGLSSSMGGSRSNGTWAGTSCTAVRAQTDPPRSTQKKS